MISPEAFKQALLQIIDTALAEDIGPGDYSSLACVPKDAIGQAKLLVYKPPVPNPCGSGLFCKKVH